MSSGSTLKVRWLLKTPALSFTQCTHVTYLPIAIKTNKMVARRLISNEITKRGMPMAASRVEESSPGFVGQMVAVGGLAVLAGFWSVGCSE